MPLQTAERRTALHRAGWARTGFRDARAVSRTIAATIAPDGARHRLIAAWCRPAALVTVLLSPVYHREDAGGAPVCIGLAPPRSGRRVLAAVVLGIPVVVAIGMLGEAAPWPLLAVALALHLYALSVTLCQGARDRAERPVPERHGLIRGPALAAHGWALGRIRAVGPVRQDVVRMVGDLLDAVVPAGETVQAFARSDREQAELELLGFAEPRGEHGPMVLVAPTTRG